MRARRGETRRTGGPLSPAELAEAALLGDLALVLCLLGIALTFGQGLLAIAMVPFVALASRRRLRASVAATVSSAMLGLLVMGTSLVINLVMAAVVGTALGVALRRGRRALPTIGMAVLLAWPPLALATVIGLALLSELRQLMLEQVEVAWRFFSGRLQDLGLQGLAELGDDALRGALDHWWLTIPACELIVVVLACAGAYALSRRSLLQLASSASEPAPEEPKPSAGLPNPAPVELVGIHHRYPGAEGPALDGVSLTVPSGALVGLVGPNGAGKSTLARIIAGRVPTAGTVSRPGPVGLGAMGGTAMVFQRPETQVLGTRVAEDVVWGLPYGHDADVEAVLARVGLAGFGGRETSTLSGGELQRVALAAALVRRPILLVSDESTAMLDPDGRERLAALLRSLPAAGTSVVHVTHLDGEIDGAGQVVTLVAGRVAPAASPPDPYRASLIGPGAVTTGPPLLRLSGVSHVYSPGTPWARRALDGIDLDIAAGESVLVSGPNGSGKSTLAWILAGLLEPSEGDATVAGQPVFETAGEVGIAFQHARLQLLRSTVGADVAEGTHKADGDRGGLAREVEEALRTVGLDARMAGRRIDDLSGGQQRRVALAGLLARRPRVLVLDEPFAGLDPWGRAELARILTHLRVRAGVTLIFISHDIEATSPLAERHVVLEGGRVVADLASVAAEVAS